MLYHLQFFYGYKIILIDEHMCCSQICYYKRSCDEWHHTDAFFMCVFKMSFQSRSIGKECVFINFYNVY